MSDSAPIAQVTAREIPVTIQGSQIVEGTDRRELFTETVKTVLVFDNGTAVNLKARVAQGQSLFLRNELSGREILCRVIEAPPPGQEGCTDLEFTIHDPDFWNAPYEEHTAPADAVESQPQKEAAPATAPAEEAAHAAESPAGTPPLESPTQSTAPETATAPASSLAISATDEIPGAAALLAPPSEAPADLESTAHVDDAKDAERLAGIVAKYARALAKRASEKSVAKEAEHLAAEGAPQDEAIPAPSRRQKAFSTLAFRLHAIRELTVKKNPIALAIVSVIVIGAALGVAWDVTGMLYPNRTPIVGITRMKPLRPSAKAKAAAPKAVAAKPAPAGSTRTPSGKAQPPAGPQVPPALVGKAAVATATNVKPMRPSVAPVGSTPEANGAIRSDLEDAEQQKHHRAAGPQQVIPAKIISQYQPSLPPWAKALDLQGVVKLDAVIDENGNLKAMKVLSGPRALESAAEGAVGLWLFAPAISDGKPVPTHMIITVEFKR